MAEGKCPVTLEPAVEKPKTGDYREFDCPTCGVFRISGTAIVLAGDNPEVLLEALQAAKSRVAPGEIPMINNLSG